MQARVTMPQVVDGCGGLTCVGANDDDSLTWLNRGVCHQALGQKQKAAADYDEAIRRQPDFERARTYRDALRGIRK